jgi:hypothetical protein
VFGHDHPSHEFGAGFEPAQQGVIVNSAAESIRVEDGAPDAASVPHYVLAALNAGAAAIHFAMMPTHAADSLIHGVSFAVAGWAQLVVAVLLVLKPGRRSLLANAGVNAVIIAAWALSRTAGLPYGAHQWHPEAISIVDGVTTAFEVAALAGAIGLLLRKVAPARRVVPMPAMALASVLVLVAATAVLAQPEAREHGHGDHGNTAAGGHEHGEGAEHGHDDGAAHDHAAGDEHDGHTPEQHAEHAAEGAEHEHGEAEHGEGDGHDHEHAASDAPACDSNLNHPSYFADAATAGVDVETGMSAMHEHADEGAPPEPKTPEELAAETGELGAARTVIELSGVSDAEYQEWLRGLHAERDSAAPDDTGHGGHMGPQPWEALIDPDECAALAAEIETARAIALAHPNAQDAIDAGWRMVTPYVPGIAAHYMRFEYVDGTFDLNEPEMLLYDGNGPDANVIGLSYYVRQQGDEEPAEGFTGDNDHYHRHVGLCLRGAMVIGDTTTTAEQCEAMGGRKANNTDGWMNHVWAVPGCESPWGLFSAANPVLDATLAEGSGQGAPCSASGVRARYGMG